MRIFVKFRQNIPGIMTNESVLGNLDIQNIFPVASIYATGLAYFLATPTLDADIYTIGSIPAAFSSPVYVPPREVTAVSSGEERGLFSRTAAGNRAYLDNRSEYRKSPTHFC